MNAYSAKAVFLNQIQPFRYAAGVMKPNHVPAACAVVIAEMGRLRCIIIEYVRKIIIRKDRGLIKVYCDGCVAVTGQLPVVSDGWNT